MDDYVCALDNASVKKAKEELNENPEDRLSAVQALREWIEQQPHINFDKTDTLTLLKYLRWAKFSQLRARENLEGSLRLKNIAPQWCLNIDTHAPDLAAGIKSGMTFVLPKRAPNGSLVIVHRFGCFDLKSSNVSTLWCRIVTLMVHYITLSETSQVNGAVIIMDFTNVKGKFLLKFLNTEMAQWNKLWQKNTPVRFKQFHFYNAGILFESIIAFFRPFLAKKFLDRIKVHDTAESLYKEIPMDILPDEYLPDDYTGPKAETLKEMTDKFIKEVMSENFRKDLLYRTSPAFSIDDKKNTVKPVTELFRKLNVD